MDRGESSLLMKARGSGLEEGDVNTRQADIELSSASTSSDGTRTVPTGLQKISHVYRVPVGRKWSVRTRHYRVYSQ